MTRLVFLNDELVTVCRVVNSLAAEVEVFKVVGVVGVVEVVEAVVTVVVRSVIVEVDLQVEAEVVLILVSLQPPLTVSN